MIKTFLIALPKPLNDLYSKGCLVLLSMLSIQVLKILIVRERMHYRRKMGHILL